MYASLRFCRLRHVLKLRTVYWLSSAIVIKIWPDNENPVEEKVGLNFVILFKISP